MQIYWKYNLNLIIFDVLATAAVFFGTTTCRSNTWRTVVLKNAAAVAKTSTSIQLNMVFSMNFHIIITIYRWIYITTQYITDFLIVLVNYFKMYLKTEKLIFENFCM